MACGGKKLVKMLRFSKSSELSSTVTSQQHGIMMSQHKMMKNTYITVVTKFQSCTMFQRRDIANLMQKVAKKCKLRSNGQLTYFQGCCATSKPFSILLKFFIETYNPKRKKIRG